MRPSRHHSLPLLASAVLTTALLIGCGDDSTSPGAPASECELQAGESIAVVTPAAGDTVQVGESVTVKWRSDSDLFTGYMVKVSPDSGQTWTVVVDQSLHTDAVGTGCLEWSWVVGDEALVGGAASSRVLLRVQDYADATLRATTGMFVAVP
jgi:hypothetical protein